MKQHEETKKKVKIIGAVCLGVGVLCTIIGFVDFFSTIIHGDGFLRLFFLLFIGFPLLAVGGSMLAFGFRSEILRYQKNESVPIFKEAGDELTPTIKNIATACREKNTAVSASSIKCTCGTMNALGNRFCKNCGKELTLVCPQCGATVTVDCKFCTQCGSRISG